MIAAADPHCTADLEGLKRDLTAALGQSAVLYDEASLRAYDCDAYGPEMMLPDAVVLPRSTAEVAAVVLICNRYRVPFTPRGAGTGLSGGATATQGGVVISTIRLNAILEVDIEN